MKPLLLFIFSGLFFSFRAAAVVTRDTSRHDPLPAFFSMKASAITSLTGFKMTLKQKITWGLLKKNIKKQHKQNGRVKNNSRTAFILGLVALGGLLVPLVNLASLPLAILAIVLGNQAKKADPYDREARRAVTLGIITLSFLIMIGFAVAIVLAMGRGR